MTLQIGVVGAGTAGAAAAILLSRGGHAVTLFERVANPKPVGAGITLQPTGQVALARLGLFDAIASRAAPIERLTAVRRGGKPLVDLPYADIDPSLRGLGVHRGVLFETLVATVRTTSAVLHCGIGIASTELDARGRWLRDDSGQRHGPYDLVVVADGSICELHGAAPKVRTRPYPWGALWLVADDPGFAAERRIYQVVDGCHTMLGFLPTGMAPGRDVSVVSLFFSIRTDRVDAWRAAGLIAWRDTVLRLEPRAEAILDTIDDLSAVLFSRYHDVAMWPWHGERIVFIGDAAHAMSPQLGQGANLALIDAVALADALSENSKIERALAAYTTARRWHLAYYQFATRALTPFFQSDSRLLGWLRDRFFPTSHWFHFLRRRMVRTMVGIDRGLVRPPFPLRELLRQLPP